LVVVMRTLVAGGRVCGLDLVVVVVGVVLRTRVFRMGVGSIDGRDEMAMYEGLVLALKQRSLS
jgi:hypothetical protein